MIEKAFQKLSDRDKIFYSTKFSKVCLIDKYPSLFPKEQLFILEYSLTSSPTSLFEKRVQNMLNLCNIHSFKILADHLLYTRLVVTF